MTRSQWRYMCSISLPSIRDSSLIISQIIEQDRGTDSPRALSEMAVCQETILPFVNAFTRMNKCIQRHQACWCDYLALVKPALSPSQQNTHTKTETIALILYAAICLHTSHMGMCRSTVKGEFRFESVNSPVV